MAKGSLAPALEIPSQSCRQTLLSVMCYAKPVKDNSRCEAELAPKSIIHCMWNKEHFCRNDLWCFRQPRAAPLHGLKLVALAPPIFARSTLSERDEFR